MSRTSLMQDIPAQICWEYLHGDLDENSSEEVLSIARIALPDMPLAIIMIHEIAYRIGYAKSKLIDRMGERAYKEKKLWIRNTIKEELMKKRRT